MQKIKSNLFGIILWLQCCLTIEGKAFNTLPPIISCLTPTCSANQLNILWPSYHPSCFFECVQDPSNTNFWFPEMRSCPWGRWFDYAAQNPQCVNFWEWNPVCPCEPCEVDPLPTPPPGGDPINPAPPGSCTAPQCTAEERSILHPADDRSFFYQCAPAAGGGFAPMRMPCAPGTWFGFRQQFCVWPEDWQDTCGENGGSETTTTNLPTITTTNLPTTLTTTTILPTTTSTSTSTAAPMTCTRPLCSLQSEINLRHPSETPTMYYMCVLLGSTYVAVEMQCEPQLLFGFVQQSCVPVNEWINVCDSGTSTVAPEPTPTPDGGSCATPQCVGSEINTLHPTDDRRFFYQCAPAAGGGWRAVRMPCAPGTWFGFHQQFCVWPEEWKDVCGENGGSETTNIPTTLPTTTILPTTSSTTASTSTAEPMTCTRPLCSLQSEINLRHPSESPTMYYVCVLLGSTYVAVEMQCEPQLLFGFVQQSCVPVNEWINVCDSGTSTVAPEPTPTPDGGSCATPQCVGSEINTLHPTDDRRFFYQCAPAAGGGWRAVRMPCAPGTWFGYRQQVCVWPRDWEDPCTTDPIAPTTTTFETTTTAATAPTTTTPDIPSVVCAQPTCVTALDIAILHPSPQPMLFYQCVLQGGVFVAIIRECTADLLFGFVQQACVVPSQWINVCEEVDTTTDVSTTTTQQVTTTYEITTTTDSPGLTCQIPSCASPTETQILHPHPEPSFFYQCILFEGSYFAVLQMCEPHLLFGFIQQTCVQPFNWIDVCSDSTTTTTELTTTTDPTTTTPDIPSDLCAPPTCVTASDVAILHPSSQPMFFYQCVLQDGVFLATIRECAAGLLFGFVQQACVEPSQWINVCEEVDTTTDLTTTTTQQVTTTTTTYEITTTTESPGLTCQIPSCSSPAETQILHPHPEPSFFYQCILFDGSYFAVLQMCESNLLFGFIQQTCVQPFNWIDVCSDSTTTTTELTTTTTTALTTTTSPDLCASPTCATSADIAILHPSPQPMFFYQCVLQDGMFVATTRECTGGLLFGFAQQACVVPSQWINVCLEVDTTTEFTTTTTEAVTTTNTEAVTPTTEELTTTTETPLACAAPLCITGVEISLLHPNPNPMLFYQCLLQDGAYVAVVRQCTGGQLFGFTQQGCVLPSEWLNACPEVTPTTTEEVTTTTETPLTCETPVCSTSVEISLLHPNPNPMLFYQCVLQDGAYVAVVRQCAAGQLFGFTQQGCVLPSEWINACLDIITTTTEAITTTTEAPLACETPACTTSVEISLLHPNPNPMLFYQCVVQDGAYVAVVRQCAAGQLFGFTQQGCVLPSEWINACLDIITTTTEAITTTTEAPLACETPACTTSVEISLLHPNPNPMLFYQCLQQDGAYVAVVRQCEAGQLFGFIQQSCVFPSEWINACLDVTTSTTEEVTTTTLEPIVCAIPTCDTPAEIGMLHPSTEPMLYYQCELQGGSYVAVVRQCSAGLLFGFDQQGCVSPFNWVNVCDGIATTTNPPTPEVCVQPACVTPEEISRFHPSLEPEFFYQCFFENDVYSAVRRQCAPGQMFGNIQQTCVAPSQWINSCLEEEFTTLDPSDQLPKVESCNAPNCTPNQRHVLWPSTLPRNFFECSDAGSGVWFATENACTAGTWFSFEQQRCVSILEWTNSCPA